MIRRLRITRLPSMHFSMLHALLPATLLVLSLTTAAQLSAVPNGFDVTAYRFDIELSDLHDSIRGTAEITVRTLINEAPIQFDLAAVKDGKGMEVIEAFQNDRSISFKQSDSMVTLTPLEPLQSGAAPVFRIRYRGIPSDGLIISKNKFGKRTFFADNWPDRAHRWIPCVDDPADKAPVEFRVTAPSHYRVVSNGLMISEEALSDGMQLTTYRETQPLPTKIMVIGVADFAVQEAGTVQDIPVTSWIFPENRDMGFADYASAPTILGWMIDHIGPFPYKKLANVQSKTIFGGMENAGAIFYYENSVNGRKTIEPTIAHEIAHQYFGDMVTEKSFADVWLSEGFATYLTHLYLEGMFGADTLATRMKNDREKVIAFFKRVFTPVVDSVSPLMDRLNTNSYEKGSWVLHMLRNRIGDPAFQKGLRTYYQRFAGSNANTGDLQKVMEEVSGQQLGSFFHQWLYTGGQPKLTIRWVHDAASRKLKLSVGQQQADLFAFPLEIGLRKADGTMQIQKLEITRVFEEFLLDVAEKPAALLIDPNTRLLAGWEVTGPK